MKRLDKNELVILTDLDQDSDEWLEWRGKGVGSSDIALLMSPAPVFDRTLGTLWRQKVGYERAVQINNPHVQRGKEKEPIIRDKVNSLLRTKFEPACLYRKDAPYLRASLDGLDLGADAILEIKAPAEKSFDKMVAMLPNIPQHYYYQVQYQLLVADAEYAFFAFENFDLDENGERKHPIPYIRIIENNYELQLQIEQRCHLFWKAVKNRIPIGWDDNNIKLFQQKPTLIIVIGSKEQEEVFHETNFEFPKCYYYSELEGSGMIFVNTSSIALIPVLKDDFSEYDIKIVSLVDSPFGFSNGVTLDTLDEHIKTLAQE